jgi:hypothetical protein
MSHHNAGLEGAKARPRLECRCPRKSHWKFHENGSVTKCTWTLGYVGLMDQLRVIAMLKAWAIQGLAPECKSKQHHKAIRIDSSSLPSAAELDELMPPADRAPTDDEDLPKPKPKRAARNRHAGRAASSSSVAGRVGSVVVAQHCPPAPSSSSGSSSDSGSDSSSSSSS